LKGNKREEQGRSGGSWDRRGPGGGGGGGGGGCGGLDRVQESSIERAAEGCWLKAVPSYLIIVGVKIQTFR
jgi:hypothetical protein